MAKKPAVSLEGQLLGEAEDEQRRAGQALHRDVAPGLSAVILELNLLLREPPEALARMTAPAVIRALGTLDRSVAALRTIELSLRPPLLEEAGLGPPLRWLAAGEGVTLEIPRSFARLPAALEWQVFAAVATLVRRGLRGRKSLRVERTRPLTLRLSGTATRAWPLAVAAARARLRGRASLRARSGSLLIAFRSAATRPRTFR